MPKRRGDGAFQKCTPLTRSGCTHHLHPRSRLLMVTHHCGHCGGSLARGSVHNGKLDFSWTRSGTSHVLLPSSSWPATSLGPFPLLWPPFCTCGPAALCERPASWLSLLWSPGCVGNGSGSSSSLGGGAAAGQPAARGSTCTASLRRLGELASKWALNHARTSSGVSDSSAATSRSRVKKSYLRRVSPELSALSLEYVCM